MSYEDFTANYHKVEICNLGPDSPMESGAKAAKKKWETNLIDGTWKAKVNAGGCRNFLGKHCKAPEKAFLVFIVLLL